MPVVEVYLVGRHSPIEAGYAGTNRNPDYHYVRIETRDAGASEGKAHPDARWIHVHEDQIQRVEICFREAPPFDFERFKVLDEDVE